MVKTVRNPRIRSQHKSSHNNQRLQLYTPSSSASSSSASSTGSSVFFQLLPSLNLLDVEEIEADTNGGSGFGLGDNLLEEGNSGSGYQQILGTVSIDNKELSIDPLSTTDEIEDDDNVSETHSWCSFTQCFGEKPILHVIESDSEDGNDDNNNSSTNTKTVVVNTSPKTPVSRRTFIRYQPLFTQFRFTGRTQTRAEESITDDDSNYSSCSTTLGRTPKRSQLSERWMHTPLRHLLTNTPPPPLSSSKQVNVVLPTVRTWPKVAKSFRSILSDTSEVKESIKKLAASSAPSNKICPPHTTKLFQRVLSDYFTIKKKKKRYKKENIQLKSKLAAAQMAQEEQQVEEEKASAAAAASLVFDETTNDEIDEKMRIHREQTLAKILACTMFKPTKTTKRQRKHQGQAQGSKSNRRFSQPLFTFQPPPPKRGGCLYNSLGYSQSSTGGGGGGGGSQPHFLTVPSPFKNPLTINSSSSQTIFNSQPSTTAAGPLHQLRRASNEILRPAFRPFFQARKKDCGCLCFCDDDHKHNDKGTATATPAAAAADGERRNVYT